MRLRYKLLIGIPLGFLLILAGFIIFASQSGHFSFNLPVAHQAVFSADTSAYPTLLHTSGNQVINRAGQAVVLKGLMPADPQVLRQKGKFNKQFLQEMRDMGANVIRIPVHPERWQNDPDYLWRYLDPLVTWSGELGMYAILDLHFIGNVDSGSGDQMPDIKTPAKEFSRMFWQQVASYFKDTPNVLFEVFNEPADISAADWRRNANTLVKTIREAGAEQPIIVGGIDYSKDLSWVLDEPVSAANIIYAAHIYPGHSLMSWDRWFGNVSAKYPVLVTEWGWIDASAEQKTSYLVGNESTYGIPFTNYLAQHGIGWVACWYDDEWLPQMFTKGFSTPTVYGQFIQAQLAENK